VRVDTTTKKIALTRADVDAIVGRTRSALPEELECVIAHSKEFSLSEGQRDQVRCDLTITAAQRARQGNGRRIDANAEFISKVASAWLRRRSGSWPDRSWMT
jgi:hypothetical protein